VLVFHSLSKRSNLPGLRSGFAAGDSDLVRRFLKLRNYGGAPSPLPVYAAAAAAWREEAHVEENRALYRAKLDIAEQQLADRAGFYRPPGGFFLWLDVGDGEAAAKRLWQDGAIRVLPGAYLARPGGNGANPGQPYIRVALVHDLATTGEALERMRTML
jgi:N-succinyldiaminopimelate aminotransferase